jgi:nucleotide-binding universal stress UspA family protein
MTPVGRILLATDGSPSASEALAFALDVAHAGGLELHVVVAQDADDEGARGACAVADAAVAVATDRGVRAMSHVVRGDPATAIAHAADRLRVALIVVGTAGALAEGVERRVSLGVVERAGHTVTVVRMARERAA